MAPSRLRLLSCYLFLSSSFLGAMFNPNKMETDPSDVESSLDSTNTSDDMQHSIRDNEKAGLELFRQINKIRGDHSSMKTTQKEVDFPRFSNLIKEDEIDESLLEEILRNCPSGLLEAVNYLGSLEKGVVLEKEEIEELPYFLLLVGPPGCGKTTLAQVIAAKLKRPCYLIKSATLSNELQSSGVSNICRIFEPLLDSEKQCVLVFDELTALTERFDSKHNTEFGIIDTFWQFIDKCKKNKNILVIGTTNYLDKIPDQLFDRSEDYTYKISKPDFSMLKKIFKFYLNKGDHSKLSEKEFNRVAKKISGFSPRRIEKLAIKARFNARIIMKGLNDSKAKLEITYPNLIKVLEEFNKSRALRAKSKSMLKKIDPYLPSVQAGGTVFGLGFTALSLYLGWKYHKEGLNQAWWFGTFGPLAGLFQLSQKTCKPCFQDFSLKITNEANSVTVISVGNGFRLGFFLLKLLIPFPTQCFPIVS